MLLVVENEKANIGFISFLKRRLRMRILSSLNLTKLSKFDEFFESDYFKTLYGDKKVLASKVVVLGANNLRHTIIQESGSIYIDPNMYYPGTQIKLVDLCNLINFGNLSVDAYPVFSDAFQHFSNNLEEYSDRFLMGVG
jgi:hypothetical protein